MQVVNCTRCGAKNRIDESRLATSEAKCGRCGEKLVVGAQDSKPAVVTGQTFECEVLQAAGRPVLVDCWAPWCGPCRMISPFVDELAAESHGRYRITKLNVDDNPQTASRFRIASIPTLLIFKDGQLVYMLERFQIEGRDAQEIAEELKGAFETHCA